MPTQNDADVQSADIKQAIAIGHILKTFAGWIFGVIAVVISVVMWIQNEGSDKYYSKYAGENLEKQLVKFEQKLDNLEKGNIEMIRLLGRLEAQQK